MRAVCEAPGKIIVTGEHFVVHGAWALAAAIGKSIRAEATRSETLTVSSVPQRTRAGLLPLARCVKTLYSEMGMKPRVRLRLTSMIPSASGLGSSASTMVAAVGAVCKLEGWRTDTETLIRHAMVGERTVHGRPSGVDVSVSAIGGVILFRMGERTRPVKVGTRTEVLVVMSGIKRETGRLIRRVSALGKASPAFFAGLCDSMSYLSTLAAKSLQGGKLDDVGRMMTYNHAVLGRVGASNRTLDEIVEICLASGCLGAKLTGAGGGGSVVAIPRRGGADETLRAVREAGYDGFSTVIPTGGARAWLEN